MVTASHPAAEASPASAPGLASRFVPGAATRSTPAADRTGGNVPASRMVPTNTAAAVKRAPAERPEGTRPSCHRPGELRKCYLGALVGALAIVRATYVLSSGVTVREHTFWDRSIIGRL